MLNITTKEVPIDEELKIRIQLISNQKYLPKKRRCINEKTQIYILYQNLYNLSNTLKLIIYMIK